MKLQAILCSVLAIVACGTKARLSDKTPLRSGSQTLGRTLESGSLQQVLCEAGLHGPHSVTPIQMVGAPEDSNGNVVFSGTYPDSAGSYDLKAVWNTRLDSLVLDITDPRHNPIDAKSFQLPPNPVVNNFYYAGGQLVDASGAINYYYSLEMSCSAVYSTPQNMFRFQTFSDAQTAIYSETECHAVLPRVEAILLALGAQNILTTECRQYSAVDPTFMMVIDYHADHDVTRNIYPDDTDNFYTDFASCDAQVDQLVQAAQASDPLVVGGYCWDSEGSSHPAFRLRLVRFP